MSIASAIVPVPVSGDGPVVDVSSLIGSKTFQLSGPFKGTYILLASHDDVKFVPVLTLDADGQEGVAQTPPEAYKSVRLRSCATALGAVTAEISGVVSSNVNRFGTLAVLPPGTSGLQPIVDTAVISPPTGLESCINVMCSGRLEGTIVVLGSIDGSSFNPVGTFQAGTQQRSLLGTQPSLEFSPLPTEDKTRYVRLNVLGRVLATTTITIGGTTPVLAPSSTTLSQAYDNGTTTTDQELVLTHAHGGGVVVNGSNAAFTGSSALTITSATSTSVNFPRVGGVRIEGGVVVGAGPSQPGEDDVVFEAGAVAVSQANTGRLGYHAGAEQTFMVSVDGSAYVPILTGPTPTGFAQGSIPFGSATGALVQDNADFFWDDTTKRLGIDVAASPTAKIHVGAGTAAAGTAPLKISPGTVLTIPELGAVEADANHIYWTNNGGTRLQLDNTEHTPFYATSTSAGLLTLVDAYDDYMVDGSEDFIGISTVNRVAGDCVRLTFTASRTLKHGQSVGAGFAPLMLYHVPGESGYQDVYLENTDGRTTFQFRPDSQWQIIAGSWS
jgi:hypothetical protein